MPETYPFLDRVRARLKEMPTEKSTLRWLASEIDRSERWFYHKGTIDSIEHFDLRKICIALGFNFFQDFENWMKENGDEAALLISEPIPQNQKREDRVAINIKISASRDVAEGNLSKMFKAIRLQGEKLGFEIEG